MWFDNWYGEENILSIKKIIFKILLKSLGLQIILKLLLFCKDHGLHDFHNVFHAFLNLGKNSVRIKLQNV